MKYCTLILLTFLLLTSCSNIAQEQPDWSHSPDEAIEFGAPSIEKDWSPQDYTTFDAYLGEIAQNAYPRLSSDRSKDIFTKVYTSVNQSVLTGESLDINQRMALALSLQQNFIAVVGKYLNAHNKGNDYSMELAHLLGGMLVCSDKTIVLAKEIIPTIDPERADYAVRMQGVEQMKSGLATQLDGTIVSLQETQTYSDEERVILAEYLVNVSPNFISFLNQSVQRELEIKFEKLKEKETHKEVENLIDQILQLF